MRSNYNIVRARVDCSCNCHYCSYYTLIIWYEGDDLNNRGRYVNIDMFYLKEKAGVKRGNGLKKIQLFLNTKEGLEWLSNYLYEKDLNDFKDKIISEIKSKIYKTNDVEDLNNIFNLHKTIKIIE